MDLRVFVLVLVVRCDQDLDVAVDLVVLFGQEDVPLDQGAYVLRAQVGLAPRSLRAFARQPHGVPLLLDLLAPLRRLAQLILHVDHLQLQHLCPLLQSLNLLVALLLLLQIVLLQNLEAALIVLRRLLDLAPIISHVLNLAAESLNLRLQLPDALEALFFLPPLLIDLVLQLAAHRVLLGEHLLQLVLLEAHRGDLLVGPVDVLGEGGLSLEGGGAGLL